MYDDRLGISGAVHDQLEGVGSGQYERPVRSGSDVADRCGIHLIIDVRVKSGRVVVAQVPVRSVGPDVRRECPRFGRFEPVIGVWRPFIFRRDDAGNGTDQLAGRVRDLHLDIASRLLAEVVIDERSERRILRVGQFRVHRLVPIAVLPRADRVAGLEQIRRCRGDRLSLCRNLAQRTHIVEHPKSTAVGAYHDIVHVVVSVKHHVADRRARQILPKRLPMLPVVERRENRCLGPNEEQALLFGVLTDNMYLTARAFIGRQTRDDARPGLAAIVRAIDVVLFRSRRRAGCRTTKTEAEVRNNVRGVDVGVTGFYRHEVCVCGQIGEIRHVIPSLAAVHRVVDLAGIAA